MEKKKKSDPFVHGYSVGAQYLCTMQERKHSSVRSGNRQGEQLYMYILQNTLAIMASIRNYVMLLKKNRSRARHSFPVGGQLLVWSRLLLQRVMVCASS